MHNVSAIEYLNASGHCPGNLSPRNGEVEGWELTGTPVVITYISQNSARSFRTLKNSFILFVFPIMLSHVNPLHKLKFEDVLGLGLGSDKLPTHNFIH